LRIANPKHVEREHVRDRLSTSSGKESRSQYRQ
jgi:hypothetical protein